MPSKYSNVCLYSCVCNVMDPVNSYSFVICQAETSQATVMKLESELREREHLLIDLRNKLTTLEAQMEYAALYIRTCTCTKLMESTI